MDMKSGIKPPHPKGWSCCSNYYTKYLYTTSLFFKSEVLSKSKVRVTLNKKSEKIPTSLFFKSEVLSKSKVVTMKKGHKMTEYERICHHFSISFP